MGNISVIALCGVEREGRWYVGCLEGSALLLILVQRSDNHSVIHLFCSAPRLEKSQSPAVVRQLSGGLDWETYGLNQ